LAQALKRRLILEEEVYRTAAYCEDSGDKLFEPETGCYMGHLRMGIATYWVRYRKEGRDVLVENAYLHRMRILEEDGRADGDAESGGREDAAGCGEAVVRG
jgi:hypothetical protein